MYIISIDIFSTVLLYNFLKICQFLIFMESFKDKQENQIDPGKVLLNWSFPEYEKHERKLSWYIVSFSVGAFMFLYSVVTGNFIFAIIVILAGVILINSLKGEPRNIDFSITDRGILLGRNFYEYDNLSKFWIIYKAPQVKKLYFEVDNILHTQLVMPIGNVSPLELRDLLGKYLEEDVDKENESISDSLGRALKI